MGGHAKAAWGLTLFLAGRAATLVTWFTLPALVHFILAGGPLVDPPGNVNFTAPLTPSLRRWWGDRQPALFFAYHVWWPQGLEGRFDWWLRSWPWPLRWRCFTTNAAWCG